MVAIDDNVRGDEGRSQARGKSVTKGNADSASITDWLDLARDGSESAREQLWVRYYERLLRLASKRLTAQQRRVVDEEDVVLTAFAAFFRALDDGRLAELEDREGLWRVLVAITDNKANDCRKHELRQKRGGGNIRGHSAFVGEDGDGQMLVPDPSPEFADGFGLACSELLGALSVPLRQIAVWKLEGYTNREIAEQLGCVEESVRRKVVLIRSLWSKHGVE